MATPDDLVRSAAAAFSGGQPALAREHLRAALALDPGHAGANQWMGVVSAHGGDYKAAVGHFEAAVRSRPGDASLHCNLGMALSATADVKGSESSLRRAVELRPDFPEALACLGVLLANQQRIEEAEDPLRRAVAAAPGNSQVVYPLARVLTETGRADEAVEMIRRAQRHAPNDLALQNKLCMMLNYVAGVSADQHFREHVRYGELAPRPEFRFEDRDRTPGRRLRVGYLSADLREHSVAYFLEPLLEHHDRGAFEVFVYHIGPPDERATPRLMSKVDQWRAVFPASDAAIIEQITRDRIDVLVELGGHTSTGRLTIMARGPAPVQVSYIGYPNTTGVPAIRYRLVDETTDPPGSERYATEQLVRLPGCFLCFRINPDAPDVAPVPSATSGKVTFGSFNNLGKLCGPTIDLWGRLLARIPSARLFLKGKGLSDRTSVARIHERLARAGIDPSRVELAGHTSLTRDHLDAYSKVDIALDPFPYNGTTSTCEALWMGVPVVSLTGETHASRVGLSLLQTVGLGELATPTPDAYIEAAASLASDPTRLMELRSTLRDRIRSSRLCDGQEHARAVDAAYRRMWEAWCSSAASGG